MIETVNVNGGYVSSLDKFTLGDNDIGFTNVIDGGGPSTNHFITKSMITQVVDRQISTEVRISTKQFNIIEEKEDGLYLKPDLIEWQDFKDFVSGDGKDAYQKYHALYDTYTDIIESIISPNYYNAKVEKVIDDYFGEMRYFFRTLGDDKFEKRIKKYTEYAPYDWGNF